MHSPVALTDRFVSYAQNFEDVMLWRALQHVPDGFYVDVGAFSPDLDSVTKAFYDRGWHGLNVEPNIDLIDAFRIERPRDITINVAVGDRVGDAVLHVVSNAGLSTVDPQQATLRAMDGYSVQRQRTELRTLASVWAEHVPEGQAVHFLKVDVEGMEREVVLGNDWSRCRPWITVIEATTPMTSEASYADWEPLLLAARYTFAYADGLNRFYVAEEHAEFLELLATPPNLFDRFVRASEVRGLERANLAEAQLRNLKGSLSWRLTSPLRRASAIVRPVLARILSSRPLSGGAEVSNGRTWVDVTDLLDWAGRPTGIPRVRAALASRYADDPGTRFFTYGHHSRLFREIAREQVQHHASSLARDGTAVASPSSTPRRHGVAAAARDRLRGLPAPVRHGLRQLQRKAQSALKRVISPAVAFRRRADALGRAIAAPVRRRAYGVAFEPSDRVVLLGNGWMQPNLQSELGRLKRTTGIRVYQILYDLSPVLYPQTFGGGFADNFTRSMHEAMSISDGMVAISEHTRSDGRRFCDERQIPRPAMDVFRLGDEPGSVQPEPIDGLVGEDFVLSVGTFELRKNYGILYQAWRLAQERGIVLPRLVIVGRRGWGAGDIRNAIERDPMVKDSILQLRSVSDGQLEWLFRHCRLTTYPSFYEGWGLPIAESLAHGKLCLAAASSAMPEVAGDLIEYFSPFSPDELLSKLMIYLDPARLARKETEIRETFRVTTWDESFGQFVRALEAFERGSP